MDIQQILGIRDLSTHMQVVVTINPDVGVGVGVGIGAVTVAAANVPKQYENCHQYVVGVVASSTLYRRSVRLRWYQIHSDRLYLLHVLLLP